MSDLIYKLQMATFIIALAADSDYFNHFWPTVRSRPMP